MLCGYRGGILYLGVVGWGGVQEVLMKVSPFSSHMALWGRSSTEFRRKSRLRVTIGEAVEIGLEVPHSSK